MDLIAIAARSANNVIGKGNKLPWPHNQQDLRWFMQITKGHPIIMGINTFESLPKLLPGRKHIVITRQVKVSENPMVQFVNPQLLDATISRLEECGNVRQAFVLGGAHLFSNLLPRCNAIYLRTFHAEYEGDVKFPDYHLQARRLIATEQWDDSITQIYV